MTDAQADGAVAIIGMAGRFPGAADLDGFWRNVLSGTVSSTRPAEDTLRCRGVDERLLHNQHFVRVESVLEDFDKFDAAFFGVNETVATALDPQHRLLLECTWSALENAGYPPTDVPGQVGVFASRSTSDYDHLVRADERLMQALGPIQLRLYTEKDTLAGFISYKLNLRGPSMSVQSACSSSLVALHLAVQSLINMECDFAVVGAVAVPLPLLGGYLYQPGGIHAPEGLCRPFDASASGTLPGCGVAAIVLRRWSDAIKSGDSCRALVRGTAVNNDGSAKFSFSAPGVDAQSAVIAEALAVADVSADSIDYVETHGTGTPIGDPIEITALTSAYRPYSTRTSFCAIGSVKANIGHLGSAAGVTSIIKTVLALEHRQIPPMANFGTPNPRLELAESPFYIPLQAQPWPSADRPARAAVSSFGMGGTNAHAILERAPDQLPATEPGPAVLVLSARSHAALRAAASKLADHLTAHPATSLQDAAFTLACGRVPFDWRAAIVADDAATAAAQLRSLTGRQVVPSGTQVPLLALVVPDSDLPADICEQVRAWPPLRGKVEAAVAVARSAGIELGSHLLGTPGDPAQVSPRPRLRVAALTVLAWSFADLLRDFGATPDMCFGAAATQVAADCAAGRIDLEEAMRWAASFGDTPETVSEQGTGWSAAIGAQRYHCVVIGSGRQDLAGFAEFGQPASMLLAGEAAKAGHRFLGVVAELFTVGKLARLHRAAHGKGRRIPLPGTDFAGERYWPRPAQPAASPAGPPDSPERDSQMSAKPSPTVTRLIRMGADAMGVPEHEIRADVGFLELGFDSIGLLQLSQLVADEFGIDVPFRAFFDELPDIQRLAAELDARGHAQPATDTSPRDGSGAGGSAASVATPDGPGGATRTDASLRAASPAGNRGTVPDQVLELLSRQTELMSEQLALLRSAGQLTAPASNLAPRAGIPGRQPGSEPAITGATEQDDVFVPFVPIKATAQPIPEPCQAYLDALGDEVTRRTAGSKALAEAARTHLANERATANFRMHTKKMLYPISMAKAEGSRIWDVDGNEYVDLAMGFGALLFGHSPDFLLKAVRDQLDHGIGLGLESPLVGDAAARLCALTGTERVAFCNSGTEAVMTATRLARAVTGRPKIAIFSGGYHGMLDSLLARGVRGGGDGGEVAPMVSGVTRGAVADTLVLDFGSDAALDVIELHGHELAGVLVEPRQSRRPAHDVGPFLRKLRDICHQTGTALIFDEIITGFRTHPGGMQALLGVNADIVAYGKAIGSGYPLAAIAGRARYLDAVDGGTWSAAGSSYPAARQTFFAGTYFKSPLAVAVLRAVLTELEVRSPALQEDLSARTATLASRLREIVLRHDGRCGITSFASLFRFTFPSELSVAEDLFYFGLLAKGVNIPETRSCFLSTAHSDEDCERIVAAVDAVMSDLAMHGLLGSTVSGTGRGVTRGGRERLPVSVQQECMLDFLGGPADPDVFYNEHEAMVIDGELSAERLRAAVDRVLAANDSLTMVFGRDDAGYLQQRGCSVPALTLIDLTTEPQPDTRALEVLSAQVAEPFDLEAGPLIRATLVRTEPQRHYLLLAAHHLVTDGWSHALLLQQISGGYAELARGRMLTTRTPAPSYAEFAREQRRVLDAGGMKAEMRFWSNYLADADPRISIGDLKLDRAGRGFSAGFQAIELDGAEAGRLADLSKSCRVSNFMTTLAAFCAVLAGRSGRQDIVVASPMANRSQPGTRRMVGFFANSPLIRVNLAGTETLRDVIARTRKAVLAVHAHDELPAEMILNGLGLAQHRNRFGYEDMSGKSDVSLVFPGATVRAVPLPFHRKLRRELNIDVLFRGDSMRISAEYAVERFSDGRISDLLEELRAVVTSNSELAIPEPGR